jgi:uncharacterized protein HemX
MKETRTKSRNLSEKSHSTARLQISAKESVFSPQVGSTTIVEKHSPFSSKLQPFVTKGTSRTGSKNWLKLVSISLLAISLFGTFQYLQFQKESELRRENAMAQQEKMLEFWKNEGLTQEEIDQKLKEQRSQFVRDENPSIFQTVFRTVRHATGTGPGTGARPEMR